MRTGIAIAISAALAFALGLFLRPALIGHHPSSVQDHWDVVNEHLYYAHNPDEYDWGSDPGLYTPDAPAGPLPSLFVLVNAGELEHVDLVLPNVPYEAQATRHWMDFVQKHEDIVWATGNPSYAHYKPSGEQPLHLQLWFKPAARTKVQTLIAELEGLPDGA